MSLFSMSMMAICSRPDETSPLLQGADRSEIQLRNPGNYYPITQANYVGEVVYVIPTLGLITTTIIGIGRPYNLYHSWSCNNSFSILFQKRKKKTRKGLAIS
jgi:hypothetical protein